MSWPTFDRSFQSHLPQSSRPGYGPKRRLQDESDILDSQEIAWFDSLHEVASFGYASLIPLGKLQTQEEDQESTFSSSPRPDSPGMGADEQEDHSMEDAQQPRTAAALAEDEEMNAAPDLDAEIEERDAGDDTTSSEEEEEEDESAESAEEAVEVSGSEGGSTGSSGSAAEEVSIEMDNSGSIR